MLFMMQLNFNFLNQFDWSCDHNIIDGFIILYLPLRNRCRQYNILNNKGLNSRVHGYFQRVVKRIVRMCKTSQVINTPSNSKTEKNVRPRYAFQYIKANESLLPFYNKYAVVPADTASNNIVLVCKKYNHGCLINEVCIFKNFAFANPTCKIQDLTRTKLWQSKQLKSTLSQIQKRYIIAACKPFSP